MNTDMILRVRVFNSKGEVIPSMCRIYSYDLLNDKDFNEAFSTASHYVYTVCENNPDYSCRIEK